MPKQKDLKRIVRNRMEKTGESYTAARARVLARRLPTDLAERAGVADATVRAKTGRTWEEWTRRLDALGATSMPHREIAKAVLAEGNVSSWWAQSVTVGYERIRGLRDIGQRRGGSYDANKSKTFSVPVAKLYRAFNVKRTRKRWLGDVDLEIRTSTIDKSLRIDWPDGTSVHAYFQDKGSRKSSVAVQHVGLPRKADIDKAKAFWTERFAALSELLT